MKSSDAETNRSTIEPAMVAAVVKLDLAFASFPASVAGGDSV